MENKKGRGRPRVHKDPQARVKAFRRKQEGHRLDGFVSSSASWRLKRLAESWGCSLAGVVERLALEADDRYQEILLPATESDSATLSHPPLVVGGNGGKCTDGVYPKKEKTCNAGDLANFP